MEFRNLQEWLDAVLRSKEQLRQELARLPYEEKIARLRRLQHLACEFAKVREQLRRQREEERRSSTP